MGKVTPTDICDNATATAHILKEIYNICIDSDLDGYDRDIKYALLDVIASNMTIVGHICTDNIESKLNLTMNGRLFIHLLKDEEDRFYG